MNPNGKSQLKLISLAGALVLAGVLPSARAQNMFVDTSTTIYEYDNGVKSTFASGLSGLGFMDFNDAGDLFAVQGNSIIEFANSGLIAFLCLICQTSRADDLTLSDGKTLTDIKVIGVSSTTISVAINNKIENIPLTSLSNESQEYYRTELKYDLLHLNKNTHIPDGARPFSNKIYIKQSVLWYLFFDAKNKVAFMYWLNHVGIEHDVYIHVYVYNKIGELLWTASQRWSAREMTPVLPGAPASHSGSHDVLGTEIPFDPKISDSAQASKTGKLPDITPAWLLVIIK